MLNGVWIFLRVRFPATWNKIGCGKKDENADENADKNTDEKKPTERLVFLRWVLIQNYIWAYSGLATEGLL